jgi:hypothetical protein
MPFRVAYSAEPAERPGDRIYKVCVGGGRGKVTGTAGGTWLGTAKHNSYIPYKHFTTEQTETPSMKTGLRATKHTHDM